MSNLKRGPEQDEQQQAQDVRSSHGNNSASETPKDVSPQDASAKDVIDRKVCSPDADEKEEEMLDEAVELTFPASDPLAAGGVTRIEVPKEQRRRP